MKIENTKIKGTTLSVICSGRFGIGSEGNSSVQLIHNEIESAFSKADLNITEIEIDFLKVEYGWGDGSILKNLSVSFTPSLILNHQDELSAESSQFVWNASIRYRFNF